MTNPKDRNFWSARVNLDLRLIVHRTESSLLLRYAGHRDEACDWARLANLEYRLLEVEKRLILASADSQIEKLKNIGDIAGNRPQLAPMQCPSSVAAFC